MHSSVLAIEISEPGDRANLLLAAIAAKLGFKQIHPSRTGCSLLYTQIPLEEAYELAEQALDEAGDEGRLIVRPLTVV